MNNDASPQVFAADRRRRRVILISPVILALVMHGAARIVGPALGDWSWLPLTIGYWSAAGLLIAWAGGREAVRRWLQPARGSRIWLFILLLLAIGASIPMIGPALRFYFEPRVWVLTIFFVLINPCAEEGYWRGLLLDAARASGWKGWAAVVYSSLLFTVNHAWMAVMTIGARNPAASAFQFVFGVLCAVVYLKTRSLRWPLLAHFVVNLLTPTVAVLFNLYVPGPK